MAAARDQGDVRPVAVEVGRPLLVDFPGLFRAADAAAVTAQRQHFFAEAVQLALNPVSAGLALLAAAQLLPLPNAVLTAVSTTLLVIVLWVARATRWGKLWYDCRNVAEEVKGLTWRYMMQLEPFAPSVANPDVTFVRTLDEVLRHKPDIHRALARHARALTAAVTPYMQRVRRLPAQERADLYLAGRVRYEQRWYADKAQRASLRDRVWFSLVFVVQLTAVLAAIAMAVQLAAGPSMRGTENAVPVLTALGLAIMGWSRSKRYGDLCSSYATSAHTLAGLESTCPSDPEEQRQWMAAVESALSREHETWRTG